MFDRLSRSEKLIALGVAALSLIGGIGAPFLLVGELRSDVRTLKDETIPALQKRLDAVEKPKPITGKGDLCAQIIGGVVDASKDTISGEKRQEPLLKMADKMDCFKGVPASTFIPNSADATANEN